MNNVKRHFHFWFLAVVLTIFVVVSAASLAGLDWIVLGNNLTFTYASIAIPVFLASIILSVWRYGLKTGLAVCLVLGASMLIITITGMQDYGNLYGTITVIIIGVGSIYWINWQRRGRKLLEQDVEEVDGRVVELQQELLEKQRTEDELVESRRRFRDLANLLPQIIWEIDTDGNVTFANRQALEAFGYSMEGDSTVIPSAVQAVIPEDQERMRRGIQKVLSGEELGGVEYTAIKKDGSTFPVLIYAARVMRNGRPVGLRGVAIDITERKQTEEKIEHAAKEWRMTFDSATNMISIHDKDFRLTRVNMAFAEAFHMQPKELIGRPCYQVVHGTDRPVAGCPCVKTLTTKQPATAELFDQHLGIHLQVSSSPVFDENGEVLSCVHVASDITERKEMEKALRDSEKNFRNSIYSSPLGIRIVSAEGELLYANRAILDMCGYDSVEELRETPLSKLYTPESYQQHLERKEKKRRGESVPSEYEISIVRKDGEVRHLAIIREKVIWDGETQFQVLYQDVTELRKAQEQLQHSQLLASLGEMTAGIAHEVNNPLGSILLYSELLMAGDVPRPLKKDLRVIHDEAKRAARIMTDLLTYSRRMGSQGRRLDLHKVLKKVIDMRRYTEMVRNIDITLDLHNEPIHVVGNSSQLTQLFMNLILNAEEALGVSNGGSISITTRTDNEWAKISVADNGPGIPAENLQQIFYPFFTTKPTGKGTGLGLSTCYGIVTAHKGLIRAEKNKTGGATFVIELPLARPRKQKKHRKVVAVA
ncbi:MAG TPA: PAS domain S-box protein [Dehalococcoidia bacterium]|nr:PAS domain S-box protein [Dehalococcoidia bacterium]